MNNNSNNKYMCMEVGYDDPDKEYETLDDDTYTDNFSIPTSSTTTSLINTDQNSYCIDFNEESLSNVKKFIENSEEFLDRKDDNDIDWLSSDFDVQSDVGSLWASTIDEFEDSVHMLSEEKKTIDDNDRCVIVDLVNGKLQRCKNTIFRPLRQLLGIWELDFDEVNKAIKVNQPDATALLELSVSLSKFFKRKQLLQTQPTSISDGKSLLLKHQFDKIQIILLREVEEKFLFQVVNAFYKAKFFINTINITHEEQLKDIFYQLSIKGIFAVILIKKDSALNHNVNMKIYKHQYQDTTKYDG
ncbi:10384_t:CDS:2 [Entrophospora sp. SA101]|nr:10384_t:CDS:2 [Entrophospora sp. SA101]